MRFPEQIQEADIPLLMKFISEESNRYTDDLNICAHCISDSEIKTLLSLDNQKRFLTITYAIVKNLEGIDNGVVASQEFIDSMDGKARLMQIWITLGSVIEALLQLFLAVYLFDYKKTGWHQWVNYNETKTKDEIAKSIDILVCSGYIDADYARSLKKTIREELRARRKIPSIDTIMLYDLIEFYRKEVQFGHEDIEILNEIRENRNCIHSLSPRTIGDWDRLIFSLKYYLHLLLRLRSMLPDCSAILEAEAIISTEMESYNAE